MPIDANRVFNWNSAEPNPGGDYVLYWMQIQRRLEYNFSLEHAVSWANRLNKPLLVYEGLQCDYPWASDRFHRFLLEGMKENRAILQSKRITSYHFIERTSGEGKGLVRSLAKKACVVVSDTYPAFIIRRHNEGLGPSLNVRYETVDANGFIPASVTQEAPYSAYLFRRTMQKHFRSVLANAPKKNPLAALRVMDVVKVSAEIQRHWPQNFHLLGDIDALISDLPLNHSVPPVEIEGTRKAALKRFHFFMKHKLLHYDERRNHPDLDGTSGMSPYLHFGKISAFEMADAALRNQQEEWSIGRIRSTNGARTGFFRANPSVESFLDQLITWRELGYHFCHHVPNFDRYDSLPAWSRATLEKHQQDPRDHVYNLDQLESAATHDPVWNAAQRQLLREGVIHNYLRMLWGKKILEWTPDPQTALAFLIELNNKYSIDGRDPNSYSGIFWILGRFDRPWGPEREIFGTVRWMSSENTQRKLKMKRYLETFS